MNCDDARALVDACVDGELDLMTQLRIEAHVENCPSCLPLYEARREIRAAVRTRAPYFHAPAGLARQVRRAVGRRSVLAARRWAWPALGAAAALVVLTVAGVLFLDSRGAATDRLAQEIVAGHVRSLLPGHLTDVVSSDQHTVKPWFAGRVDFSPPVADLAGEGYPLAGGRLDYVAGRTVAALVYRRNRHVLNVFVWPSASEVAESDAAEHGYHVAHWSRGGLAWWVVSDLNVGELHQFIRLLQGSAAR